MKVLLSQTLFANAATHHGKHDNFLIADLDSGGWPQSARNRALRVIRKGFPLHVCGDQHLTTPGPLRRGRAARQLLVFLYAGHLRGLPTLVARRRDRPALSASPGARPAQHGRVSRRFRQPALCIRRR